MILFDVTQKWFMTYTIPPILPKLRNSPASNKLFNNLESENDTGVAIIWIHFTGIPHWEKYIFLILLTIFATSNGEVLRTSKFEMPSFLSKFGTGSSGFFTFALDEIFWLKILPWCNGHGKCDVYYILIYII